jgi:hypothetical protein
MAQQKKTHDISVIVGKYTDNNGNEKNRWQRVGCIVQRDDGSQCIIIDRTFNPAGVPNYSSNQDAPVYLSAFPIEEQNGNGNRANNGKRTGSQSTGGGTPAYTPAPGDDDIPF